LPTRRRRPRHARGGAERLFADPGVSGDRGGDWVRGRSQSGRRI